MSLIDDFRREADSLRSETEKLKAALQAARTQGIANNDARLREMDRADAAAARAEGLERALRKLLREIGQGPHHYDTASARAALASSSPQQETPEPKR